MRQTLAVENQRVKHQLEPIYLTGSMLKYCFKEWNEMPQQKAFASRD